MSDENLVSIWQSVTYLGAVITAIGILGTFLVGPENTSNSDIILIEKNKKGKNKKKSRS